MEIGCDWEGVLKRGKRCSCCRGVKVVLKAVLKVVMKVVACRCGVKVWAVGVKVVQKAVFL